LVSRALSGEGVSVYPPASSFSDQARPGPSKIEMKEGTHEPTFRKMPNEPNCKIKETAECRKSQKQQKCKMLNIANSGKLEKARTKKIKKTATSRKLQNPINCKIVFSRVCVFLDFTVFSFVRFCKLHTFLDFAISLIFDFPAFCNFPAFASLLIWHFPQWGLMHFLFNFNQWCLENRRSCTSVKPEYVKSIKPPHPPNTTTQSKIRFKHSLENGPQSIDPSVGFSKHNTLPAWAQSSERLQTLLQTLILLLTLVLQLARLRQMQNFQS